MMWLLGMKMLAASRSKWRAACRSLKQSKRSSPSWMIIPTFGREISAATPPASQYIVIFVSGGIATLNHRLIAEIPSGLRKIGNLIADREQGCSRLMKEWRPSQRDNSDRADLVSG